MKYNPHGIIVQLNETQTSKPIIVVNLYDYEFQSLWLFVKAAKHSPNITLLYFSICPRKILRQEDLSLTPTSYILISALFSKHLLMTTHLFSML